MCSLFFPVSVLSESVFTLAPLHMIVFECVSMRAHARDEFEIRLLSKYFSNSFCGISVFSLAPCVVYVQPEWRWGRVAGVALRSPQRGFAHRALFGDRVIYTGACAVLKPRQMHSSRDLEACQLQPFFLPGTRERSETHVRTALRPLDPTATIKNRPHVHKAFCDGQPSAKWPPTRLFDLLLSGIAPFF